MDFKDKKILIMGLGIIGKGLKDALFFYYKGAEVTVTDLKSESELQSSIGELKKYPDIQLHLGKHLESDFKENDIIVRNPAIPKNSKFLNIARENNKEIVMEDSLFTKLTEAKVIGITGTRGKTTTSTLIYEILKYAGLDVYLSGNIRGTASLPLLGRLKKDSYVVLELSSWQLQGFADEKISPQYAVITNIYEDHLNRYKGMGDYVNDKKNIYKFQQENDFLFLNEEMDPEYLAEFQNEARAEKIYFSKRDCQDYKTNLIGSHNLENIATARSIALKIGIDEEIIRRAVENFQSIEFRLEKIREINGVSFINDSASTAPIAGIKALNSFEQKVLLIAGGASKDLDLNNFVRTIKSRSKKVALLEGSDTSRLKELLPKDLILGIFQDLESAVKILYKQARAGDIILLSPGSASFGMFQNEFDRGEQFNLIVNSLTPLNFMK
jgi:UDP-N-acetylmuramoylalanine--D-glutamate ligase